jgi:UDP-3-O-[3-hydroxymyristoyl] glucosamine N-acyltransferase
MGIRLKELAALVGGRVDGNEEIIITGIAGIEQARAGDITFVANPKYLRHAATTQASAIVCAPEVPGGSTALLKVANPYLAYAKIMQYFYPLPAESGTVHPGAVIGTDVRLGRQVTVYPLVFIGDGAVLEDGVTVYPHCFIGRGAVIGSQTLLYPNVTIREGCLIGRRVIIQPGAVIGSDGFGFARDGARYCKIPQTGIVQIDDDVEIGAGTTVDRATMGRTWIKRGTKIDNLVQIAHNVTIGEDSAIVAQVGISGSTSLGNRVTMAGQSATVGHVRVGDDVIVGARGAVASDVEGGQVVSGAPHMPHREWLKAIRCFEKLPEMRRTLSALEREISALRSEIERLHKE